MFHPSVRYGLKASLTISLASLLLWYPSSARAYDHGANFVVYDHHMEKKGETEVKLYSDIGRTDVPYLAQLLEIEHGITDHWTATLYLEGQKESDESYRFDGTLLETRFALFREGTAPLNPVLYLEYARLKEGSLYIREVVGRVDDDDEEEESSNFENELEGKLILGQDLNSKLRFGFNLIDEIDLQNGNHEFGYAVGFSYALIGTIHEHEEDEEESKEFKLERLELGGELYGGFGDSAEGLTLDPDETARYAGINLAFKFENGLRAMFGGAFGLTEVSQDALFRTMVGYEFE